MDVAAGWHDFFVAEAGASAALAGLVFVAVSINLARILRFPHLPARVLEGLMTLLTVLIVATFALIPGQRAQMLGIEIGCTGLAVWGGQVGGYSGQPAALGARFATGDASPGEPASTAAVCGSRYFDPGGKSWRHLLDRDGHAAILRGRASRCMGSVDRDQSVIEVANLSRWGIIVTLCLLAKLKRLPALLPSPL